MMKIHSIHYQRMTLILLLVLSFQLIPGLLYSQEISQPGIHPVMKVSNLNKSTEEPMRLDILNVDIKIIGQIAVTTLDMTFYNGNSRVMEGEFNFPLGEGQTVSRFALDMNGVLREGVVVEKEKGRKTFEAIVRRGVDPGLLEMTAGNNFRMRVFPLPAKGTRRLVLAFEQELTNKGTYDLYMLPLKMEESIRKFSVYAEVIKNTVKLDADNNELASLSFSKLNDSYVASFEKENFVPDKKIALSFPHIENDEKIFTAVEDVNMNSSRFYLTIRPNAVEEAKILPKRITLIWDNSNSAKDRNIEKELSVLDAFIQKIGNLSVELVTFNIKTGDPETFEIVNGNWDKLKSFMKAIVYDGGTSIGCLDFTKYKSDEILLFTDGLSTYGTAEPKFSTIPVYTLNSCIVANPSFLTYLAQRSGGVYTDIDKFTKEEVVTKLTTSNFHFISSKLVSGLVSEVYPSLPCQFTNSFSLAGKMLGKTATLVLNFGVGSTVTYSKTIVITADNDAEQSVLQRMWAGKKITELSYQEEKNRDEITKTGKKYGIVTPNTSLIVLENLNDYLENDIEPPVEMRERYFERLTITKNEAAYQLKNHINNVVNLSNEQTNWWNKNFLNVSVAPVVKKHHRNRRYTVPVIINDDNQLKSQEELTSTHGTISIADVKGSETGSMDIADVKANVIQEVSGSNQISSTGTNKKNEPEASIQLNAWDPETPYLKVLEYAGKGNEYSTYLKLKTEYGSTPAFYTDIAGFFVTLQKKDTALVILSNLAELRIESPQLLRVLGNMLMDFHKPAEAALVFEKVLKLKGEEPQSYRDLGLAYEASGNYQSAINTLYEVVKKEWDGRFPGIEVIVMNEINNIIATHPGLVTSFIDNRLLKVEPVNIRVTLTWDTDNCDMDLWVTDPTGEKCFFENKLTHIGGKISNDFTRGYGPEEFMIKNAVNGKYLVQANYYGTRSQALLAPVNLHLTFITNSGKPNQKKKEVTIRLNERQDVIEVGKFSFMSKEQEVRSKR